MTEAELDTLLKRNPALRVRDGMPASKIATDGNPSLTVRQLLPNTEKPHAKCRNHKVYVLLRGRIRCARSARFLSAEILV